MRPLNKGTTPLDPTGNLITVSHYDHWRKLLIERIGYYCCYCNMPLSHNLQVEHVVPKNPPQGYTPGDPLAWDNMLLACGPCNRKKSNTPINFDDYYFPEETNTLIPFEIVPHQWENDAAIVNNAIGLQQYQAVRARNTINLTGLDVIDRRADIVDIRYLKRREAILTAEAVWDMYQEIKQNNPSGYTNFASMVARIAKGIGFFTIWFDRFEPEPEVIRALIDPAIIPGTAQDCFDATQNYRLVPRNPGNLVDPI